MVGVLLAFLMAGFAKAQDPVFTASVDKNPVGLNDVFSLEITLENARGEITPPDLSDFSVIFGPARSSSLRIINGRQSSTLSLTYTMRPRSVGTFEIGIAKVTVNGKVLTTSPIKVEVVEGSSRPSAQSPTGATRGSVQEREDPNIMVRIELSKNRAYKGEGIVATYVLLSRYTNFNLRDVNFPTLDGFWSENVQSDQTRWERTLVTVNGLSYRKAVVRRQVLFPQRTGTLKLEPFSLTGMVNRSFINPGTEVDVRSNSPTIEVLPLPRPEPETFHGAVGNLETGVSIDRTEVEANEAIKLKINVTGTGNLKLISAPEISFPKDFEVYDPEITDRINIGAGGVRGARTFTYLIIPRYAGSYQIPEINLTHFDPGKKDYVTTTHGPFDIEVSGSQAGASAPGAAVAKSRVENSATDIRYIVTDSDRLERKGQMFFGKFGYWTLLSAPPILLVVFVFVMRRREELEGDVVGKMRRRAKRVAKSRLKTAENALKASESKQFYAEVSRALFGYLSNKLGIPPGQLTKSGIADELRRRKISEEVIEEVMHVLTVAEQARFSPTKQEADEMFYRRSAALIEKLEELIG